jgi:putative Holliday junction resolvase
MMVNIMRSLGLDVGDKKVGVALSDPIGILASPLTIIDRTDNPADIAAIIDIVTQHQVGCIIVGLPLSMNGSVGHQAEKVRHFAEELRRHVEITVEYRDESLSTVTARNLMRSAKKDPRARDDAVAAAVILQAYLDEAAS